MKNVKKWMLAALILPATLGTTSVLAAGGDRGSHGRECGPGGERNLFKQLDLTDDQQAQLRELRQQGREAMKQQRQSGARQQMHALHQKEQALVLAADFDQAAAKALARQMAESQAEHRVSMMAKRHQMLSILTPEQKSQFVALQQARQEEMKQCWQDGSRGERRGDKGHKGKSGAAQSVAQ